MIEKKAPCAPKPFANRSNAWIFAQHTLLIRKNVRSSRLLLWLTFFWHLTKLSLAKREAVGVRDVASKRLALSVGNFIVAESKQYFVELVELSTRDHLPATFFGPGSKHRALKVTEKCAGIQMFILEFSIYPKKVFMSGVDQ